VENEHRIRQAARNLKRFLASADQSMQNVVHLNAKR
jgi:alanine-synthesizing transaminase